MIDSITEYHPPYFIIKIHNLILRNRLLATQISINLFFYVIDDCFWDFVECKKHNVFGSSSILDNVLPIDRKSSSGRDRLCCQNRYRQCCQYVMKPTPTITTSTTTTSTEITRLHTTTKPTKPPCSKLCKISTDRCN